MCLICIAIEKETIGARRAKKHLREMSNVIEEEHIKEVEDLINNLQAGDEDFDERYFKHGNGD